MPFPHMLEFMDQDWLPNSLRVTATLESSKCAITKI